MSEKQSLNENSKVDIDQIRINTKSLIENKTNQLGDSTLFKDTQTLTDDSSQKKRKGNFSDSNRSRKKVAKDDYEIRFLISSKDAGGIIGKKGSNITYLRQHFDSSVVVTDCQGPERVLSFTVNSSRVEEILTSVIGYLEENNQKPSTELRLLLHTNYVGSIIGKNGSKLKEIRQKNNTSIKIFPQCCPRSSERVCIVQGKQEDVILCIRNILDIINSHQQPERIFFYHPANYIANGSFEYGGYSTFDQNLGNQIQRGSRDLRNENFRSSRTYSQRFNNRRFHFNNKNIYNTTEAWNRNNLFNYDSNNNWSQQSDQLNYQTSQQVTSPINNYQQNTYQQSNYQASQSNDHSSYPYYLDSTFQSSSNQVYNNSKQNVFSNDYNQISHLNNNQLASNQFNNHNLNTFWTSYYNVNTNQGNQAESRANLSVLSTVPTNEH